MSKHRREAYNILKDILQNKTTLNQVRWPDHEYKNQVYDLVYGVLRQGFGIFKYIETKAKIKLKLKILLSIGMYELTNHDSAKEFGVVNDIVELSKKLVSGKVHNVVNAVLRNFIREKAIYSKNTFPKWYEELFLETFKKDQLKLFKESFLEEPMLSVVINSLLVSPSEFKKGLEYIDSKHSENLIFMKDKSILKSDRLEKGHFFIQDEAAFRVVLNSYGGKKILDCCAAPGGKSYALSILFDKPEIHAIELKPKRAEFIKDGAARLMLDNIEVVTSDLFEYNSDGGEYDLVFLDAPCSSLGTIRKNPDILWGKVNDDLPDVQYKLLDKAKEFISDGGKLLYSVCTFNKAETIDITDKFIKANNEFKIIESDYILSKGSDIHFYAIFGQV